MKKVRVGIIGVGNIGTAHATCIFNGKIQGMELGALCDISPARRTYCREHFAGVPIFEDCGEMFRSGLIDAAIVSTPHRFHCQIVARALESHLHVLSEKPADVSVTKAKQLYQLAEKSDRVFAIMFNQRTNPLFMKAREIVRSGKLGNLKRSVWIITNWYRTQQYYDSGDWRATWAGEGGGVLLNQAPHNLDLWQWICGMPCQLRAQCDVAKFHNIEVEDDATLFARYENGATGTFITSTGEYPGTNRLEISGELGKLVLENNLLKWWKLPASEREYCRTSLVGSPKIELDYEEIAPENAPESGHQAILQNFTNAILHGEKLISPGTDGIYELSLSNAAYLSSWKKGEAVNLPLDNEEFDRYFSEKVKNSHVKNQDFKKTGREAYSERWSVKW